MYGSSAQYMKGVSPHSTPIPDFTKPPPHSSPHQHLNLIRLHRHAAADQLAAGGRDDGIVFDADADVVELLGHAGGGANINAGLDGEDHAGVQDAGRAVDDDLARQRVFAGAGLAELRGLQIGAAVVYVHAQPVASAVHVKLKVAAVVDHVLQAADFVFVQQADVQHALGQHFHAGFVRVGKARACFGGGHGGFLRRQHQVVKLALRCGEFAVGGESAGDVAGVAIQLTARITAHQAEAAQLDREIGAQNDRVTQLKLQVERFRQLARDKFAPELQVQQKQDDLAEQAVKLESLKRVRAGIDRDLAIARTELPMLRATLEGKLATLSRDEASFVQSSRESLARRAYEVTAANDGTVERVIALSGQSVVIGAPLMQVQTGPRVLIADIYVPTRSAGFLRDGQQVRLAIDAFPMERFGHVAATVTDVGRSVIAPGDAGLPVFVKEASFRVRAQLATPEIVAYGETYPLKSGLSAQADIALDERPLYRWVIEPVLRMRGRL